MDILHIDSGREMRGGQFQALALVRGLAARGHRQMLLAHAGSPLYGAAIAEGLPVLALSGENVFRWSRRTELTHAHDAHAHTLAALISGAPVVVARRVAFPIRKGLLSRWKYGRARRFIAISKCVRKELLRAGIPEERIDVVYDGTDVPEQPASGNRIIAPATDDPRKGSDLALQAGALAGVELSFSGNLAADLPRARMFLYMTRAEGLGSAILLAMAHGVPVIASRVGGIPEIVEHEVTGLLVENDPRDIAAAVLRLAADPALAASLGAEARNRVMKKFTMDKMVEGTLASYAKIGIRE